LCRQPDKKEIKMDSADTKHTSIFSKRISLGAIALILAGLTLMPQGILTANVPSAPEQNVAFAAGANSLSYRFSMMLVSLSLTLFILGIFALYGHLAQTKQEKLAFAGLIVTVGFLALFLPLTGFAAFVVPAIGNLVEQGQMEMISVLDASFKEPFLPIQFFAGILWNIGTILLGIAIWRSKTLWKWGGLLFIVYGVIGIPSFLDVKVFQIVAPTVGGLAQIAVGISLWRFSRSSGVSLAGGNVAPAVSYR
jgi:hypothetical protein